MDDLSEQLNRILSDPEQMAQIAQLAQSLGLDRAQPTQSPPESPPSAADSDLDTAMLGRLLPLLSQSGGKEAQIFGALRPYLSQEDQRRVDRALRAAKLSRLASVAMQSLGEGGSGGLL